MPLGNIIKLKSEFFKILTGVLIALGPGFSRSTGNAFACFKMKRKKVTVRFGEPIDISDIKKMDRDGLAEVERRMQEAFDQLDKEIDPTFKYESTEKE